MSHIIYGYVLSEKSLSFITSCFHSSLKTIPKLTVSLNPITNLILIPTMESSFQFTGKKELSLYFQFYHVYTSKLSRHVLTSNLLEHIILIIFFKRWKLLLCAKDFSMQFTNSNSLNPNTHFWAEPYFYFSEKMTETYRQSSPGSSQRTEF